MAQDPRGQVLALIELAVGEGTPPHEAAAAAMAACRRIKKEGLLLFDFLEEGGGEGSSREELVRVEIPFIILTQSADLLRISRIEPPKKHSSHVLLVPKKYVRKIEMMGPEETKAIGWGQSGNIIKSLTLLKSYFDVARQSGWDRWH